MQWARIVAVVALVVSSSAGANAQSNLAIKSGSWSCTATHPTSPAAARTVAAKCLIIESPLSRGPLPTGPFGISVSGGITVAGGPLTFATPFGDTPEVFLTFSTTLPPGSTANVPSVSATGFTMNITLTAAPEASVGIGSLAPDAGFWNTDPGDKAFAGGWIAMGPPPPPPPVTGTVIAKYLVLGVVYAPPGSTNPRGNSQVTYTATSTSGTSISTEQSFKKDFSISFDSKGGFFAHADTGGSYQSGESTSSKNSSEVKISEMEGRDYPGGNTNDIDHDNDVIFVWLNPQLNVSIGTSTVEWGFAENSNTDIIYPYVGWLKDPKQLPDEYRDKFTKYGITADDISAIIARDPLVKDTTALSNPRFQKVFYKGGPIPYVPGENAATAPSSFKGQISNTNSQTVSATKGDSYSVGLSVGFGAGASIVLAKLDATLTLKDEWTWTANTTNTIENSTTTQADLTIGGPGFPANGPYSGPTQIQVYLDTYYNTFAFDFIK